MLLLLLLQSLLLASATATADDDSVFTPRIVSGTLVPPNSPLAHGFAYASNRNLLCAASLVAPHILLTAAHCHDAFSRGVYIQQPAKFYFRRIVQQRMHPSWPFHFLEKIGGDVLVLQLDQPIPNATLITLNANPDLPVPRSLVTAVGNGFTSDRQQTIVPNAPLQQVTMRALPLKDCRNRLVNFTNVDLQDDGLLCTLARSSARSVCRGDSGGPLFDAQVEGALQVGVTSFTQDCSARVTPNGFARVSHYYDWIQDQICDLSDDCALPGKNYTPEALTVTVGIQYDANPFETIWSIRHETTNQVEYVGPQVPPSPWEQQLVPLTLEPGSYYLEVLDARGNGLFSDGRVGSVWVDTVTQGNVTVRLLREREGRFGRKWRLALNVPVADQLGQATNMPTRSPSETSFPTAAPDVDDVDTAFPTMSLTVPPVSTGRPSASVELGPQVAPVAVEVPVAVPVMVPVAAPVATPMAVPVATEVPVAAPMTPPVTTTPVPVPATAAPVVPPVGAPEPVSVEPPEDLTEKPVEDRTRETTISPVSPPVEAPVAAPVYVLVDAPVDAPVPPPTPEEVKEDPPGEQSPPITVEATGTPDESSSSDGNVVGFGWSGLLVWI